MERAAIVSDVRGGTAFEGMARVLEDLTAHGTAPRVLFLEASEEVLIDRYKETRRRHPLASGGQVVNGIRAERELLAPLKSRADVVIDTTDLSAARLRRIIADKMLPEVGAGRLAITFLTYGFKNGAPRETDLAFDVRFLPNPYYVPELRNRTGLDRKVVDYVEGADGIQGFYDRLIPLLDYLLPAYVAEGKAHLTIGIGCTGGRHRSVVIAEKLAALYGTHEDYVVDVVHRDIEKSSRRP